MQKLVIKEAKEEGNNMDVAKFEQSQRYSYIGMSSHDNYKYAIQYKLSFEILYNSNYAVDTIALPMLYSLRHYIELILKYNIEYFHQFSNSKNMVNKQEHKLIPLAKAFQEHWNIIVKKYKIRIDDKEDYFSYLFKLIDMINKLDPNSMSFRYSHSKDNNKHFDGMKQIDIFEIKKLFDKVALLLNYSIDIFDDQTGLMHGLNKSVLLSQR